MFLSPVDFEKIETKEDLTIINLAFSGEIISPKIISLLPYGCAIENSPIIKALHYMDLNFKNQITLEQISRYVGLTPTYFSSIFSQKMNTNFKSYLTSLRLDYAAKLLIMSDFNVTEICYASGFNDFL